MKDDKDKHKRKKKKSIVKNKSYYYSLNMLPPTIVQVHYFKALLSIATLDQNMMIYERKKIFFYIPLSHLFLSKECLIKMDSYLN